MLLAFSAAWWTYRDTIPEIEPSKRWILGTLRFASLAIILLLLFEPLLQRESVIQTEPVVAVLIDNSESMALADSLTEGMSPSTANIQAAIEAQTRGMDTRVFTFGESLSSADSLGGLELTQSRTDISNALSGVAELLSDDNFAALVLVSDGLYNSGTNPIHVAERFPVPIISVSHGDSTVQRDVRIVDVVSNEIVYAGSIVPVQVRIRNDGYDASQLTITLTSGSQIEDRKVVPLPASGQEVTVDLEYETSEPGRKEYTVSVSRFENEITYRNNAHRMNVQILDQKKSILLVAGAPSPDVSAFMRMLRSDDTAEVTPFIQDNRGSFYEGDLPADLTEFDLIILMGYPGPSSIPADSRRLVDTIKDGTPYLFVMDRRTNLGKLERNFGSVLPARTGSSRSAFLDGTILQTPSASSHAIFDIEDRRDVSIWRRLPPISLSESPWSASPGATVLATSEVRGIDLGDPIFVVGRQGNVRSAAILAHGFWRWSILPEDLEPDAIRFDQLFANLVQWLYATDDDRLVRVYPSQREFAEGESVVLRGEVYDESLLPVTDASLSLLLTSPEGQVFPFEMQARGNGRYSIDIGSLPAGTFSYAATATRDDVEIGEDTGAFTIGQKLLEYRRTQADFAILSQISNRSGGPALLSLDTDEIRNQLESLPNFAPVSEASISQSRLWQRYPFLLVVLVLLSIEWFFRKRFGMV